MNSILATVINKNNGPGMALLNEMDDRDEFVEVVFENAQETISSEHSPIIVTHKNYKVVLKVG